MVVWVMVVWVERGEGGKQVQVKQYIVLVLATR
jgi:hypothetical protein